METEVSSSDNGSPYRVLSIDGGGYLGLATASFAQQIERHFNCSFSASFDLFCGTSTGAIIAAALAVGKTAEEIVGLYQSLGPAIFRKKKAKGFWRSRYSLEQLRECLEPHIGNTTLGGLKAAGKSVLITAFNRTTGKPRVFKPDHSKRLSTDDQLKLIDVVLASASAPTYFASMQIANPSTGMAEVFCDGGVACNHPALIGFSEASYELGHKPTHIKILSLSTPRKSLAEGKTAGAHRDQGKWQWKDSIFDIFADSNSDLVHENLRRIVEVFEPKAPIYRRIRLENQDGIAIDDASEIATTSLMDIGSRAASLQDNRRFVQEVIGP